VALDSVRSKAEENIKWKKDDKALFLRIVDA
jgi:hypothetical protein